MARTALDGNPANTSGDLPKIGSKLKDFKLVDKSLSSKSLNDFEGETLILNVFPSVNTGVCSASVRKFNEKASQLKNTKVLCISKDLPFAQQAFCAAEGLDNVMMLSDFRESAFGKTNGLLLVDSAFEGLLARCVIILDTDHTIKYIELVPEIAQEPDYEAALKAL
ncbi:thiol peroxidase [Gaetbulibacter aestuarii]|uniref:Thiol peroxidase n=1 Tax=Gaetbulibacter aestuarii TaxID=1502358 RepID=A0ABW7N299_9FLAO